MNEVRLTSNFEPDASTYRWIARGVNQLTRFNKLSSLPFWMPNNVTRHHQFRLILLKGMEVASTEAEDDLGVVLELIPPPSLYALPTESNMTTLQEQQTEEHDYQNKSQIEEEKLQEEEQQPSSESPPSLSTKITAQIEKSKVFEVDKSNYPQGCTLTVKVFSPYTKNNHEKIKLQEEQQSPPQQQQQEKLQANVQNATMSKESSNETLHLISEATESANIDGENLQVCIPHLLSASTLQKELEMLTSSSTSKDNLDANAKDAGSEEENNNNKTTATVLELVIEATIVVHVNIIAEHVTRSLGSLWNSVTTSMSQLWTHGTQLIHHEREEFAEKNESKRLVKPEETNKELTQKDETQGTHGSAPVMNEADSHVSGWFRSTLAKTVTASTAESLFANALSTIQHVVDVNNSNTNATTNQNKNTYHSDIIKNVGEETSMFTSDINNQQINKLPWNDTPPRWIGRESVWKELIGSHIITDDGTFLYGPPTTWSQDHKALILQMGLPYKAITSDFVDHVNKLLPIHSGLLTNEALSKKRYELVPKRIDEEKFWRNYFWKVKCLSLCENEEAVKLLLSILNAPNNDNTTKYSRCTEINSPLVYSTDNTPKENLIVDKHKNNKKMVTGKESSETHCLQKIERELLDANEAADLLKEYLEDLKQTERHHKSDDDEMLMIKTAANECAIHLEEITNYIRSKELEEWKQSESECSIENSKVYKEAQNMESRLQELLQEYEREKINSDDKETNSKAEEIIEETKDWEHTAKKENVKKKEVNITCNESTATCEEENNTTVQNEQILKESELSKIVNEANMLTAPHDDKKLNSNEEKQNNKKNDNTKISINSNIIFAKMPWEEEDEESEDNYIQ